MTLPGGVPGVAREAADLGGARSKDSVAKSERMRASNVCADEIALNDGCRSRR